jgi:hypothetical protein
MLGKYIDPLIRGEKPTRAGLYPVRKFPSALRQATGRGERTRVTPRGVVTKWSEGGELVRLPSGGVSVRRTRPTVAGSAAPQGVSAGTFTGKTGGSDRVYRNRSARQRSTITTGTLTSSKPESAGKVTSWYKQCENRLGCGGGAVDFTACFTGLSISRIRPDPWPVRGKRGCGRKSTPRGVAVVEGLCLTAIRKTQF